jgi:membrane fusion protein (multidrug efflux system)
MAPPEINVVKAIQKDIPIYREFVGQVYGSSDIPIRARVSGFLEGIHFQEGTTVKKGQLLYTIDPEPFKAKVAVAESKLAEAQTSLAKAESDLNRIKPLSEINAVSKSDLDAAVAQFDAAQAYVDASRSSLELANINLGYCWVKSPLNGLIGKTKAKVGEFVGQNPNPVILNTVSTTDTVLVEFFLTEADFIILARQAIKDESIGKITDSEDFKPDISLILADGSTFKYGGHINFVDRSIDPSTGSLLVQTVFPNPEKLLRPGLYAKVKVMMAQANGAIIIPQRCITELQGQYSVFVVNDSSVVKNRRVEVGPKVDDYWLIKDGLSEGEVVVIDALQKVADGTKVEPKLIEFKSQFNNPQN